MSRNSAKSPPEGLVRNMFNNSPEIEAKRTEAERLAAEEDREVGHRADDEEAETIKTKRCWPWSQR